MPFKPGMLTITQREPIGVVGAIIPWNVPLLLMALKIAPALVAGNAVVVKSAEEAPLAVLRACQIMNQVLPPGILNILSGDGPGCGAPLVAHKGVGKVTFTGSVETGKLVYKMASEKLIPVTLELGGKSPMIVMGDADIDKAVDGAVIGMRFTRQGQSCTAASRIFVQDSIHDAFVAEAQGQGRRHEDGRSARRGDRYRLDHLEAAIREGAQLHQDRRGDRRAPRRCAARRCRPIRSSHKAISCSR